MLERIGLLSVFVVSSAALACLWDSDTFSEEALTQKDVAEIVRGRLGKHSDFFYEEKVAYTKPLIDAGDAGMDRYDDLAVAYDKLGKLDDAIAVMNAKEARFPKQYTTLANLGSFHGHKGEYEKALELLNAALVMNPDAHFGREKYQVKAIEYLQKLAKDPKLQEHHDLLGIDIAEAEQLMFGDLGKKQKGKPTGLEKAGISKDVFVALAGIIRYGSGEKSPHVWLSLGVASALQGDRHLAIRSFARAKELGHPRGADLVRVMSMTLKDFEGRPDFERLRKEWDKGQAEMKASQDKEDALLKAGKRKQVFGY
jgi:tetratricopeptide (TPR) repeat protein